MQDDHTLLQIDPSTLHTERTIGLSAIPSAIATDDRNVWVLSADADRLFQIDAGTVTIVRTVRLVRWINIAQIRTAQRLWTISFAAGAGAAWLTAGRGSVIRVDSHTGTVHSIAAGSDAGVAYGSRAIWSATITKIWRIEPQTLAVSSFAGLKDRLPPTRLGSSRRTGRCVGRCRPRLNYRRPHGRAPISVSLPRTVGL